MPYLIHTPFSTLPYVLDDEDDNYVRYFNAWGWHWEYRPYSDPRILEITAYERRLRRQSLCRIWGDEYRRRLKEEELKRKAEAKAVKAARKQALKESGEYVKPTWRTRVLNRLRKKPAKEAPYYKDDIYINHLEDLQKTWFDAKGNPKPIAQ
jgi:hypothetical protein